MIDLTTHKKITVSTDGEAWPYIMLPLEQLDAVTVILQENNVPFWVDSDAISLNGKPEVAIVNLGRGADAVHVQQLLDDAT